MATGQWIILEVVVPHQRHEALEIHNVSLIASKDQGSRALGVGEKVAVLLVHWVDSTQIVDAREVRQIVRGEIIIGQENRSNIGAGDGARNQGKRTDSVAGINQVQTVHVT